MLRNTETQFWVSAGVRSAELCMQILAHLIAVILAFIAASWRQDRVTARLFAPYAAWVAFASVLNASIFA